MTEIPFNKSRIEYESDYKPEIHRSEFTLADWVLSAYHASNRINAEINNKNLTGAHIELQHLQDDLATLAELLAAKDPEVGLEIIANIEAQPDQNYGEVGDMVRDSLRERSNGGKSEEPPR